MGMMFESDQDWLVREIRTAINNRPPNWRKGQAAFNRLYELSPGWADHIRGGPLDPFHRDERLDEFFEWLPSIINTSAQN